MRIDHWKAGLLHLQDGFKNGHAEHGLYVHMLTHAWSQACKSRRQPDMLTIFVPAGCVFGYCVDLTWSALTSEVVGSPCIHNGGTGSRGIKVTCALLVGAAHLARGTLVASFEISCRLIWSYDKKPQDDTI